MSARSPPPRPSGRLCDRIEQTARTVHVQLTDHDRAAIAQARNPATEEGTDDVFTTWDGHEVDLTVHLRALGDRCRRATVCLPARA